MSKELLEYINFWEENNAERERINILAIGDSGNVYGIMVRFPNVRYRCEVDEFEKIKNFIERRSGNSLFVSSTCEDMRKGFLNIEVAFRNPNHSNRKDAEVLKGLLNEVLPSLENGAR